MFCATEGLICLAGLELLGLQSLEEEITEETDMQRLLMQTSDKIVDFFLKQHDMMDVAKIQDADDSSPLCTSSHTAKVNTMYTFEPCQILFLHSTIEKILVPVVL